MKKNLFNLQNTKNIYQQYLLLFILFFSGNAWGQTTFSTPGTYTWTCPPNVTTIQVEAWGGGGAGGGTGTLGVVKTGGGGGGGAYAKTSSVTVVPGNNYTIIVGAGGTGVSAANGNAGGNSSFGSLVIAAGGNGGTFTNTATGGPGGSGGAIASSIGTTIYRGGNGATGTGTTTGSGAGGSGGGTAANGGDASGITAGTVTGGGSGASGKASNGDGNSGSAPGGGGSGSYGSSGSTTARLGGAGGAGRVILTYTGYCTPTSSSAYYITSVSTSGATTNFTNTSVNGNGYSNFYDTKQAIVSAGNNFSVSFAGVTGSTFGWAIWIDWNKNNVFDSGERVYVTPGYVNSGTSGTITVPASQAAGDYVMRILADYNLSNPSNSCSFTSATNGGEAEDYKLTVSALSSCTTPISQPSSLIFGTTSASTVNASFTSVASPNTPSGYLILRSTSATAPTLVNGTSYTTNTDATIGGIVYRVLQGSATASLATSIAETGLDSNTIYYYYIYSYNSGCTGQPYYLTTSPLTGNKITCPAPATNTASTVTNTGVSVSWTASVVGGSAEAIKYRFELYSDSGRTTPVAGYPLTDTTSPVNITSGLTVNTNYYYRIIAYNSSCQSTNLDGSFYNGVCIPGTTSNTTHYISNFTTTKGYSTNINKTSTYFSSGYQDNYATDKVEMYPTGSFDFSYTTVGSQLGTSIWVDWNNDWVFDTSERVFTTTATGTAGGNGTITVPAGKALGDYRMRVRTERYASSPDNPCSSAFTAETEDYKISVVAQPDYVIYTDAASANNTVNNTLNIYFKDFDGYNNFYTNDQLEIWMHAGIKTSSATWQYQNAGQDFNNTSTLIKFTRESTNPNVYKATVKLADWFCIPTGTTVEGLNLVFRNQYGIGGNDQTADMVLNLTSAAVTVNVSTIGAASAITTNSATISWTAPAAGAVKGFDYYYNTSNTAPTAGTTPNGTVAGNVYTANLSSLSAATTYYFWVRTKGCDANSAWSASGNFTTACAVVNAPTVIQTFDTYLPPCWAEATGAVTSSSVLSGTTSRWDTSANFGNGSGSNKGVKINLYGTNNDWLISNQIDLGTTASQYRVSYKMAVTSYNGTATQSTIGTHQVRLIVSTDGGTTWSNTNIVKTYTGEGVYTNTGTTEHVNLIGYSGIVKFAFVASTTSTSPDVDFHLDDFVVETIPPTLLANNTSAISLSFVDQAITTTSATQSFNLSGLMLTGAPGTITISAPAGFEVSSVDNAAWGTSTTVNYSSSTLADKQINVRFKPTDCTPISNAVLTISGGGATVIPTVTLSGKGIIPTPTAIAATDITATTFTANWQPVAGATGYELDVYNYPIQESSVVEWNFPNNPDNNIADGGVANNLNKTIITNATGVTYVPVASSVTSAATTTGGWLAGSGFNYWKVSFETTGFKNLKLSSAQRSSNTGPRDFKVQYSLDDVLWIDVPSANIIVANNWTSGVLNNISLPLDCENKPLIYLRWIMSSNIQASGSGNVASGGTSAIDNIVIVGNKAEYAAGYNPKVIVGNSVNSDIVTGLSQNTTYNYVVRAITSTCESANSNEIAVTTNNTVVWDGSAWSNIDGPTAALDSKLIGAYNIPLSFETNNLEITNTGSLDIKAQKDVTVYGNITLPADNKIVVESDANLVQKNVGADNNSNNTITVKRTALQPTKGYTFWSSPVAYQNLYSFSNGYNSANGGTGTGTPWNRFFVYKESTDTFVTTISGEITLGVSSVFNTGRGYAIRGKNSYTPTGGTGTEIPSTADEFSFTGKMHNGSLSSQILKNSCGSSVSEFDCTKGYNLIGNPYPSNIDFDALYNLNNTKIYGTAYFWTNNDIAATNVQQGSNYTGNNYAIYNLTGGTPAVEVDHYQLASANPIPNGTVKVGQGFIIKAKKVAAGTPIDFTNAVRMGYDADAHFYNSKKAEKNRFWLKMTSPANISNTILLGYINGATNGFEIDYDGELFVIGSDAFYSLLPNKKLAIQGKGEFTQEDVIPLGTKHAVNGMYKISLSKKDGIFSDGQKVYLKDKQNNTYTDLTSQDYTFNANQGVDDARFEIVYKNNEVLGVDSSKSDFIVYRDGNYFIIQSSKTLGKIELYDASGKLIQSIDTNKKEFRMDGSALLNGVYIIKAENYGNIRTKKIIK